MGLKRCIEVTIFSSILLLGFAAQQLTAQNFFSVLGTVMDGNGRAPIPSVRVSLEDENSQPIKTVFTDSSGHFRFGGLRAGNYRLSVETAGLPFEPQSVPVELQSMSRGRSSSTTEEPTLVDIMLKRKKSTSGTTTGVIFAQVIPPLAREEYNRGASSKDLDSAVVALTKALDIFPDYFDALQMLGTLYVKKGQFEDATSVLLRAVEINNKAYISMYGLGVAYLNLNRFDESENWLERAAEGDSTNPNVFMMLGLAYGRNNQLNESETALKKAYQLGGASAADAHLYLAGIYNKKERFGEAWRELELYLKEAKGLKDKTKINEMIDNLKAKERAREKVKP